MNKAIDLCFVLHYMPRLIIGGTQLNVKDSILQKCKLFVKPQFPHTSEALCVKVVVQWLVGGINGTKIDAICPGCLCIQRYLVLPG